MEVEPSGLSQRQKTGFAISDLRTCVWGEIATPQSDNVIPANKWAVVSLCALARLRAPRQDLTLDYTRLYILSLPLMDTLHYSRLYIL